MTTRHRRTILDALSPSGPQERVHRALGLDDDDHVHVLAHERFAPCRGCFGCWIQTPGRCGMRDDANPLMADMMAGEEVVWTTPVRTGGWHPLAKAALDRTIGLVSPFFTTIRGETHHRARYAHHPRWGVVAVLPPDARGRPDLVLREQQLFRRTVARNTLNLHGARPWVAFVHPDADVETMRAAIQAARTEGLPVEDPPVYADPHPPGGVLPWAPGHPGHAVAWIASGKPPGESVSEALAAALLARLADKGWTTRMLPGRTAVRLHKADATALEQATAGADLLIIASPIYVDSLPAPVLFGLDALHRRAAPTAVLPLLQCGFPESAHTVLALELIDRVAARWGAPVAGHLAVGGGGALLGADLAKPRGRAWQQAAALDQAAAALRGGHRIPAAASATFASPVVGPGIYRAMGNAGWLAQAWQHGTLTALGHKPFEEGS